MFENLQCMYLFENIIAVALDKMMMDELSETLPALYRVSHGGFLNFYRP